MKKLAIVLLVFTTILTATASIQVEPAVFELFLNDEERITEAIRVTNFSQLPLTISVSAYDWYISESGEFAEARLGSLDSTLQGHLRFNPRQFALLPGQTQIVRVTIDMPSEPPLQRRSVIFFSTEQTSYTGQIQTVIQTVVGATLYVTNRRAKPSFTVHGLDYIWSDSNLMLNVITENTGDIHFRTSITYDIYDLGGQLLYSDAFSNIVILPGQKHTYSLPVKATIVPGLYKVVGKITNTTTQNVVPFSYEIAVN
ncbi:MAG TPA: hypothetical protein PKX45_07220 [Bacillota bacterium]|nr:hypothetical protein [Bacillota bacterium]